MAKHAAADDAGVFAGAYVIPRGRDEALGRVLRVDPRAGGFTFLRAVVQPEGVRARYRDASGASIEVLLVHPSCPPEGPHVRTRQFCVGPTIDSPAARALVEQLAARVLRWEVDWAWQKSPAPPPDAPGCAFDTELLALRGGLRAGLRATFIASQAAAASALYTGFGLAVVPREAPLQLDGRAVHVLYVARTEADARGLLRAEADRDDAALGALLGYPSCCVTAFVERIPRLPTGVAESFVRAKAAWVARPAPRLNHLLAGESLRLISFEPCRFDCPEAIATADRVAELARAEAPARLAELERELSCDMVVAETGARARIWLAPGGSRTIARALAVRQTYHGAVEEGEHALAAALVGAVVDEDGALRGEGAPAAIAVLFRTACGSIDREARAVASLTSP